MACSCKSGEKLSSDPSPPTTLLSLKWKENFFDFKAPRLYFATQLYLLWRHVQLALLVQLPAAMNQKNNFALPLKLSDALNQLARRRYFSLLRNQLLRAIYLHNSRVATSTLESSLTWFTRREFLKFTQNAVECRPEIQTLINFISLCQDSNLMHYV